MKMTASLKISLKSISAALPRLDRGMPIVLGSDPKGENFLYANGNSIIIRNIKNPAIADVYSEHSALTTVAKYSPSGFYIASGDVTGKLRIWDTTQKEHILKNEYQPLGGAIKDIAWSEDSKRILVVGDGRERFGSVFLADTGSSVGEIMGHSKLINSADYKPNRPYRIATGSEDTAVGFFEGPPFKFKHTLNNHTRFVQAVRYAPNGEIFISAGADGKMFIYDGKLGEMKSELGNPAHKGGIYAISFSPDSKYLLSASGDKTAKLWDIAQGQALAEWQFGKGVEDMQQGCLWLGDHLITVSLSGYINYLDRNNTSSPAKIVKGHNQKVTCMTIHHGPEGSRIYTGGSDGRICHWDPNTGENDIVQGKGHSTQVQEMAAVDGMLITCSMDDTVMFTPIASNQYGNQVKLDSQPKGLAAAPGGLVIVTCLNQIVVLRNQRVMYIEKTNYEANCAAIHCGGTEVAVGGSDNKVHVYNLSGDTLTAKLELEHTGAITDVKYSPDGAYLAACDTNKRVVYYTLPDYKAQVTSEWGYHTAKVNKLAWTPDSRHLASCSLDTMCIVWTPGKKMEYTVMKGAHPMSHATSVAWLDANTLVSAGHDGNLKQWTIRHD